MGELLRGLLAVASAAIATAAVAAATRVAAIAIAAAGAAIAAAVLETGLLPSGRCGNFGYRGEHGADRHQIKSKTEALARCMRALGPLRDDERDETD